MYVKQPEPECFERMVKGRDDAKMMNEVFKGERFLRRSEQIKL